jgi:alanyl-tRNA synthetase
MPVGVREMEAEAAFKTGATALFEEKYGDRVRVVSLSDFSKELCGGTHTDRAGNIGVFKIIGESSVASGIRRIEALTGEAALAHIQQTEKIVRDAAGIVKEKPEALAARLEKILAQQKFLEKELDRMKAKVAEIKAVGSDDDIRSINGIRVLVKEVSVETPAALRGLADRFREKIKSGVVVLGSRAEAKVLLVVLVSKDLVDRLHAGDIVKQVSAVVGGGGGGRPDMAQAGGSRPEKLDQALKKAYEVVGAISAGNPATGG